MHISKGEGFYSFMFEDDDDDAHLRRCKIIIDEELERRRLSLTPQQDVYAEGKVNHDRMPTRDIDGDRIHFTLPADPVSRDLFEWWIMTAFEDYCATVPKMLEYGGHTPDQRGSADLRLIGDGLMELLGWESTEENQRVAQELGCWFYDLGKGGRLVSDYQQRRQGKADTWFDKSIYAMMARRIQMSGSWP